MKQTDLNEQSSKKKRGRPPFTKNKNMKASKKKEQNDKIFVKQQQSIKMQTQKQQQQKQTRGRKRKDQKQIKFCQESKSFLYRFQLMAKFMFCYKSLYNKNVIDLKNELKQYKKISHQFTQEIDKTIQDCCKQYEEVDPKSDQKGCISCKDFLHILIKIRRKKPGLLWQEFIYSYFCFLWSNNILTRSFICFFFKECDQEYEKICFSANELNKKRQLQVKQIENQKQKQLKLLLLHLLLQDIKLSNHQILSQPKY